MALTGMERSQETVNNQIDQALSFMEITMRGVSIPLLQISPESEKLIMFNHYFGKGHYTCPYPYNPDYLAQLKSMPHFDELFQLRTIAQGLKNNIPLQEHRKQLLAIQAGRYLRFKGKIAAGKQYKFVPLVDYVNRQIAKLNRARN